MSEKKTDWITRIIPVLAFAAGIIITSVGGIMTTSSSLKLMLFESEPYSYISEEECRYDYSKPASLEKEQDMLSLTTFPTEGRGYYERTEEEIEECIQKRFLQEQKQFENRHKQNIVDGVAALIVGGILLLVFRRRNE